MPALLATRDGILNRIDLRWRDTSAICVVMAANGYPDDPQRGSEIRGLDAAGRVPDVKIFHAGTKTRGRPHPRRWRAGARGHARPAQTSPPPASAPTARST